MTDDRNESAASDRSEDEPLGRRNFLRTAGVAGVAVGLAGCAGNDGDGSGDGGGTSTGGDSGGETSTPGDTEGGETMSTASDSASKSATLQFFTWPGYVDNADQVMSKLRELGLPEWIDVEMADVFGQTDDARSQYNQWLNAGRAKPDLMAFDTGWINPFVYREQVMKLEDKLPSDLVDTIKSDYNEGLVRNATDSDGNLWAFPHFPDLPMIQYNKAKVQEAGYDTSDWATTPMSWSEFAETAADVAEKTDTKSGYVWQASAGVQLSCCVFNEFATSYGGAYFGNPEEYLFGPIGDRPVTVNEKPVVDSLKMGRAFLKGPDDEYASSDFPQISPPGVYQWGVTESNNPFQQGDAVFSRNWPFLLPSLGSEDGLGKDLGTMPMPSGVKPNEAKYPGTGGSVNALGGWHIAANPNTEHPEAVVEFIKAMANEEMMLETFKITGWLPPKPSVLDSSAARDRPVVGRYLDTIQFLTEHAQSRPATTVWPTQSTRVAQRAQQALKSDSMSPQSAMDKLKTELTEIENQFDG